MMIMIKHLAFSAALAAVAPLLAAGSAGAEEAHGGGHGAPAATAAPVPPPAEPRKVRVIGADGSADAAAAPSEVDRYCAAIAQPAADARAALQTQRLKALEAEVNTRIDELEAKRREYQDWLAERQAFLDATSATMVNIYAAMKPDAAAAQLVGLKRPAAASLLARLKSRQASAILAEMPAPIASELAALISEKTDKGVSDKGASAKASAVPSAPAGART